MKIRVQVELLDNGGLVEKTSSVLIHQDAVDAWPKESVIKVDALVAEWARCLFLKMMEKPA